VLDFLRRHPQGVVLACFFCSGATGLIYEVVWSRRLTLVFGVTVLAYSTVLAAFLGGLALGSLIFGRLADRRTDPLRMYAMLEAAVGLFCFATPWLFTLVERGYVSIYPSIGEHLWLLRLVRFALAAVVMVVPTALMGGTLPVLSRAKVHRLGEIGTGVGALYGTNTLGAVLGATAAGFFLLPAVGLKGSIYLAAVVNLAIALVAYAIHTTQPRTAPAADAPQAEAPPEVRRGPYAALLVAYGLSGAAALVYEIVWTRILALAFGTSVYAFSGMLAAFLAGIALGSIVPASKRLAWVDRLKDPVLAFGLVQIGIAVLVTGLTPVLDRLPFVFVALFKIVGPRFWALELGALVVSFLVMLPAAALMGFAFPLVTRVATEQIGALGRRLSGVYAANTFGTVVGSFAAGFILIPLIGARWALAVGVGLNAGVGVAYLLGALGRRRGWAGAGLGLAAVTALVWGRMPEWNHYVLSAGAYIYAGYYGSGDARSIMERKELLYYRDALTATLSVTRVEMPGAEEPVLSLQINGKTDASTGDLSTQLMHGHLPVLLSRDPSSVLLIGLASGCTLGAVEQHPEVRRMDCVEIEPAMADVTGYFREMNRDCLKDPRARLIINDARNYVLVSREKYDVLTSEPSNPWIAGIANLFTLEHFRLCRDRMAPDGIFCQWVPIYNLAPEDFRCIAATFQQVFPNSSVWIFPDLSSDAYLVATQQPLRIDVVDLVRRATRPEVAGDLARARLYDAWDLLGGYVFGPEAMAAIARNQSLNTDDFPRLEFSSPLRLYSTSPLDTLTQVLGLGQRTQPPVGRMGVRRGDGYHSALAGLRIAPPWRVRDEQVSVARDLGEYGRGPGSRPVKVGLRIACDTGAGEAEILVARSGEFGAFGGENPEPSTPPARTIRAAGHDVSVWTKPSGWIARWVCSEHQRVYLVRAAGTSPPERALAALTCDHGGH
jgi:spermidine synthase